MSLPLEAEQTLDRILAGRAAACLAVYARREGRTVCDYCAGGTNPDDPQSPPLTRAMRLDVGSVTKPFTGALVYRLVERGEVALADPVKRYIPEYRFGEVTLLHLLTHTAGYDPMMNLMRPRTQAQLPEFLARVYAVEERIYPLGEQSAYWSYGYSILVDVIQRVTGEPFEAFAQRELLGPLAMSQSTFDASSLASEQIMALWDGQRALEKNPQAAVIGDTGLLTTARDLTAFGQMLLDGGACGGRQVFAPATVEAMCRECTGGRFMRAPFFFYRGEQDMGGCFGDLTSPHAVAHTGYTGCMLLVDPPHKLALAVTTNTTRFHEDWKNYGRIANLILAL